MSKQILEQFDKEFKDDHNPFAASEQIKNCTCQRCKLRAFIEKALKDQEEKHKQVLDKWIEDKVFDLKQAFEKGRQSEQLKEVPKEVADELESKQKDFNKGADFGINLLKCPVGESEWKKMGKAYGYWSYFENKLIDKMGLKDFREDVIKECIKALPKKDLYHSKTGRDLITEIKSNLQSKIEITKPLKLETLIIEIGTMIESGTIKVGVLGLSEDSAEFVLNFKKIIT